MVFSAQSLRLNFFKQTKFVEVTEIWLSVVLPRTNTPELSVLNLSKVDLVAQQVCIDANQSTIENLRPLLVSLLIEALGSVGHSETSYLSASLLTSEDDFIPVCLVQPFIGLSGISVAINTVVIYPGHRLGELSLIGGELNLKQRSKLKLRERKIVEWTRETYYSIKSFSTAESGVTVPSVVVGSTEIRESMEMKKHAGQAHLSQTSKTNLDVEDFALEVGAPLLFLLQKAQDWTELLLTYSLATYSKGLDFYRKNLPTESAARDLGLLLAAAERLAYGKTNENCKPDLLNMQPADFVSSASVLIATVPRVEIRYSGLNHTCILDMVLKGVRVELAVNRLRIDFERALLIDPDHQELGQIEFMRISFVQTGLNPHSRSY